MKDAHGRPVDLRSDTVTRPTPSMRRAMAEAEVGDDVFREDPTVRRWKEHGVLALSLDDVQIRAVTHYDVSGEGIARACASLEQILREHKKGAGPRAGAV